MAKVKEEEEMKKKAEEEKKAVKSKSQTLSPGSIYKRVKP